MYLLAPFRGTSGVGAILQEQRYKNIPEAIESLRGSSENNGVYDEDIEIYSEGPLVVRENRIEYGYIGVPTEGCLEVEGVICLTRFDGRCHETCAVVVHIDEK